MLEDGGTTGRSKTLSDRFVRSDGAVGESAPEDYLILDLGSGRYFGVGEVGGFIWERLDGEQDLQAITLAVATRFDVDPEIAAEDLIELVTALAAVGLVAPAP